MPQHPELSSQTASAITLPDPQFNADAFLESDIFDHAIVESLTAREKEILTLILDGKTNKEIAQQLCRVERTVEYHRNRLMHKLDAHNSTELLKKAISCGFCSL